MSPVSEEDYNADLADQPEREVAHHPESRLWAWADRMDLHETRLPERNLPAADAKALALSLAPAWAPGTPRQDIPVGGDNMYALLKIGIEQQNPSTVASARASLPTFQRAKQYRGDHSETFGGVTLNIDSDAIKAPVASVAVHTPV